MPAQQPLDCLCVTPTTGRTVLSLRVRNHPGVMSHICGLFARRAYNLEGILCMPLEDESQSRVWLLVGANQVLDQVCKQLAKLEDVLELRQEGVRPEHFTQLATVFGAA